jgi:hypothetical protein
MRELPRIPPSANSLPWTAAEGGPFPVMIEAPVDMFKKRRPSAEGDNGSARSDELYSRGPAADGYYHCPFEGQEGCTHKREKLKCNYE